MRQFLLLNLFLCFNVYASGQYPSPDAPNTFMRFLKVGDLAGVQSTEGTTSVVISTYEREQFEIAKAILKRGRVTTNAKEFAAENPRVRKTLESYLANHQEAGLIEDKLYIVPLMRTTLGKITEVGDDFVLIEFDGDRKRRCVIAKSAIAKIYPNAIPIRFAGPRRVASSTTR